MQPQVLYLLLVVLSAVLTGVIAQHGWRYRHMAGGVAFTAFAALAMVWSLLVGLMAIVPADMARVVITAKYLVIGPVVVATFVFIGQHTGRLGAQTRARLVVLLTLPLVATVLSWWDGAGMVQGITFGSAFGLTHVARIEFGVVYWLFTGYLYALVLIGIGWLVIASRGGAILARAQALPLIVGTVAPLASNVLLISGIAPRAFDPMPVGLAVSGAALWWGALGGRMLELVPVARHVILDSLHDGVIVLDGAGRMVDVNPAAARALAGTPSALLGRRLADATTVPTLLAALDTQPADTTAPDRHGEGPPSPLVVDGRMFDVRVLHVPATPARAIVLHDVTERQRWHDEQARLIGELRVALAEVKTLSGLLPICAGCKKIRDEQGEWQPMEAYLHARTHARFSHGMCPSCVHQWYPGLLKETSGQA